MNPSEHFVAIGQHVTSVGAEQVAAHLKACTESREELLSALKECSFRLATLVAATGDFTDVNARALDAAGAAIDKAEARV